MTIHNETTVDLVNEASALLDTGQIEQALNNYNAIIQREPGNAEAWLMKGAIAGELGRVEEALSAIKQSLAISSNYTDAHLTLGSLLQATGRSEEALASFEDAVRSSPADPDAQFQFAGLLAHAGETDKAFIHAKQATELDPQYSDAWQLLGWLQHQMGKFIEAEQSYKQSLTLSPKNAEVLAPLGMVLARRGEYAEAIRYLEQHLQIRPHDVEAHNALGTAFMRVGKIAEAAQHFEEALHEDPEHVAANANLGMVLQYSGQLEEARNHLQTAIIKAPNEAELHYQMGGIQSALGEFDNAISSCQKAAELDPCYPNAIAGQADILQKRGDYEAALELIRPLLDSKPVNIQAALIHASLSKHFGTEVESISQLESLTRLDNLSSQDQLQIHNALGKIYDRVGKYGQAFESFSKSNKARQSVYDPVEHEQLVDSIIRLFGSSDNRATLNAAPSIKSPLFIVGMPRSGTTLVEQILASHPGVHAGGEFLGLSEAVRKPKALSSAFPDYLAELGETQLDLIVDDIQRRLAASGVDRSPCLVINERPSFLYLGMLVRLFPNARIIHCVRDSKDTCLSCYFQLLTEEYSYTGNLKHLGHYYRQYRRLMEYWERAFEAPIFPLQYEELISDQENTTRALIDFCGLQWDDSCLRFHKNRRNVVTPSYDDVHQPIYSTSVGRWKNYEPFIDELLASLKTED